MPNPRSVDAPRRHAGAILRLLALPVLYLSASVTLHGCSSSSSEDVAAPGPKETLTAADFRGPDGSAPAALGTGPGGPNEPAGAPPGRTVRPLVVESGVASEGLRDIAVLPGEPKGVIAPGAAPADKPIVVDALIGQINGKPIYASRFLAPMDRRLRAKRAELKNNTAWQRAAGEIIISQLYDNLRDELFLAEARAELSPEQRQGLFYFLNQVRDNLASFYGGSREEADARLQEKELQTFEGKVEQEKNQALIRTVFQKYIAPRVNPSWRDVTRQYDRDRRNYNPPPVAVIRLVYVDAANAKGLQEVTDALAAGKPFAEVAELPANVFPKGDEGVVSATFDGDLATAKLFLDPDLNANAQKLTPGGVVGPFDYNKRQKVWMHLEQVKQPAGVPLEEVQLKIYQSLYEAKLNEEAVRFLKRLEERASFTAVPEMAERLLLIASERYLIAERVNP